MLQLPNAQMRAVVNALTAVGPPAGLLNGVKVKLFQNAATPGPDSVLADFTEATFPGYAESAAVVWGAALSNALNQAFTAGGTVQFTCTGAATPNTIHGYYLVDGATGNVLIAAEAFASPQPITAAGQGLVVQPIYVYSE